MTTFFSGEDRKLEGLAETFNLEQFERRQKEEARARVARLPALEAEFTEAQKQYDQAVDRMRELGQAMAEASVIVNERAEHLRQSRELVLRARREKDKFALGW